MLVLVGVDRQRDFAELFADPSEVISELKRKLCRARGPSTSHAQPSDHGSSGAGHLTQDRKAVVRILLISRRTSNSVAALKTRSSAFRVRVRVRVRVAVRVGVRVRVRVRVRV